MASTSIQRWPLLVWKAYQKRSPLSNQLGVTETVKISLLLTFDAVQREARS